MCTAPAGRRPRWRGAGRVPPRAPGWPARVGVRGPVAALPPSSLPPGRRRPREGTGGRAGGGHSLLGLDQKCLCRRSSSCSPPAALSPRRSVRRTGEASVRSSVSPSTRKCTTGGRTAGSRCTPVPSGGRAGLPFHAPGATADGSPPEDTRRDCPRPMGGQTEARGGVCLVEGHEKFGQQCR